MKLKSTTDYVVHLAFHVQIYFYLTGSRLFFVQKHDFKSPVDPLDDIQLWLKSLKSKILDKYSSETGFGLNDQL